MRRWGGGDGSLLRRRRANQAQAIFAALHFHLTHAAVVEYLNQLFDVFDSHETRARNPESKLRNYSPEFRYSKRNCSPQFR